MHQPARSWTGLLPELGQSRVALNADGRRSNSGPGKSSGTLFSLSTTGKGLALFERQQVTSSVLGAFRK